MQVENLESTQHSSRWSVAGNDGRFSIQGDILGGAEGFEGVGNGQRKGSEGLSADAGLGIGQQKADKYPVAGMLVTSLSQGSFKIDIALGNAGRIQGTVKRAGIGDEQTDIAGRHPPG